MINMRFSIIILSILFCATAFAQKPTEDALKKAVDAFNNALIKKDSTALKTLIYDNINYGHSDGWIQSKKEIIGDLFNGKITYNKIGNTDITTSIESNTAWVRAKTEMDVILEEKPLVVKLNALQVWIWKNKHWMLFARQSVKL